MFRHRLEDRLAGLSGCASTTSHSVVLNDLIVPSEFKFSGFTLAIGFFKEGDSKG